NARKRLLERRSLSDEGDELLGHALARDRPQPRSRAATHDHRDDLSRHQRAPSTATTAKRCRCKRSSLTAGELAVAVLMGGRSLPGCTPFRLKLRALQCSKLLCHQPKPNDGKVMIERVCEPNSRAPHDRKAGGVDGGQLVQIRASKIVPRLLQIAQLAWKNPYRAGLVDGFLPCQRDIPIGVTIEKCECLDDHGNGTVKFRACPAQQLPLLSRLRM